MKKKEYYTYNNVDKYVSSTTRNVHCVCINMPKTDFCNID